MSTRPKCWNATMENSMELVAAYMPQIPFALHASCFDARALRELGASAEQRKETRNVAAEDSAATANTTESDACATEAGEQSNDNSSTLELHNVHFARDEAHPNDTVCVINVRDVKKVEHMVWWLQLVQPRAIQLCVDSLSEDDLRSVLRALLSTAPRTSTSVPIYTNLLELKIGERLGYKYTNVLGLLSNCSKLRKLDLSQCTFLWDLEGLASLVDLEELNLTGSFVEDMAPLRQCTRLKKLLLANCGGVDSLSALDHMTALEELDLTGSFIHDIRPLRHCVHMRKLLLGRCRALRSLDGMEGLLALEELDLSDTSIGDVTPLQVCVRLKMLYLGRCRTLCTLDGLEHVPLLEVLNLQETSVDDVAPLYNCRQMKKLYLGGCRNVRNVDGLEDLKTLVELERPATFGL